MCVEDVVLSLFNPGHEHISGKKGKRNSLIPIRPAFDSLIQGQERVETFVIQNLTDFSFVLMPGVKRKPCILHNSSGYFANQDKASPRDSQSCISFLISATGDAGILADRRAVRGWWVTTVIACPVYL
jgi:hypothetical protein